MGGAIGGNIGNGFVVGGAAEGASVGMAGSAYGIACALSAVMVAIFLNNFIYNGGYMSMADYTRKRYHNEIPGTIYDLSTAISSIGLIAGQIMAGKALFWACPAMWALLPLPWWCCSTPSCPACGAPSPPPSSRPL